LLRLWNRNRRKEEKCKTSLIATMIVQILSRTFSAPFFLQCTLKKLKKGKDSF
jgi:hypothetical protein